MITFDCATTAIPHAVLEVNPSYGAAVLFLMTDWVVSSLNTLTLAVPAAVVRVKFLYSVL